MKKFYQLLLAVMALFMATSCSNVEDKMQELIPEDAIAVFRIDVPNAIEHSGIVMEDGKIELPDLLMKTLKEGGLSTGKIEDATEEIADCGIDFSKPAYGFVPNAKFENDVEEFVFVGMAAVDDEKKLIDYLEDKTDESFEEKDGKKVLQFNRGRTSLFIFDDLLVMGIAMSDVSAIKALEKATEHDNDITKNESAMKAISTSDDINVWINSKKALDKVSSELEREINYMPSSQQELARALLSLTEAKAIAYHATMADNEFKVKMEVDMSGNGDFEKLTDKIIGEPSAELLKFMPAAKNMAAFSVSIKGAGLADLDLFKKAIQQARLDSETESILVDFIKSINGPVTVGVASNEFKDNDYCVAFAIKAGKAQEIFNKFTSQFDEAIAYGYSDFSKVGNEYRMQVDIRTTMAFGCTGDVLYVKAYTSEYAKNATDDADAKAIIGSSTVSALAKCSVDGMNAFLSIKSMSAAESSAIFYVKKGGEKLKPLDTAYFFLKLAKYLDNDFSTRYNSYSYDENDYDYGFDDDYAVAADSAVAVADYYDYY